jgi:hypothetical protein
MITLVHILRGREEVPLPMLTVIRMLSVHSEYYTELLYQYSFVSPRKRE